MSQQPSFTSIVKCESQLDANHLFPLLQAQKNNTPILAHHMNHRRLDHVLSGDKSVGISKRGRWRGGKDHQDEDKGGSKRTYTRYMQVGARADRVLENVAGDPSWIKMDIYSSSSVSQPCTPHTDLASRPSRHLGSPSKKVESGVRDG